MTEQQIDKAVKAINTAGWTCHNGEHEPGNLDTCRGCRLVASRIVRTVVDALETEAA